ncbi:hypothetical protein KPH14_011900 [Odynerus spinipes]|uniref:Tetratricopeptide repeat protein 29 n=1 Tax=Odynerus spinipes TaxID=1348599 RepID=A0AAD9R9L4_9HYME|nr:hypothetical protein KPH14_011900 [Odynerus spinipes]
MMPTNWDFCKDLLEAKDRKKILQDRNDAIRSTKIKNLAQAEWHNVKQIREDLKAMLPMVTLAEAKRFYLQHEEAIVDELMEKGLKNEADFFKELIECDEEKRNAAGPGTLTWNKPRLKDQKELLNRLKEAFIVIGNSTMSGQVVKATDAWIKISLSFQAEGEDWWWLTKRLYQNALKEAELITKDNGQNITLVRYLYGRFLFITETDWLEALKFLDAAREASERRIWNASKTLGEKQETIFREASALIYKILIILAKQMGHGDPEFAVQASCHDDYVIDALYELGRSHLRYGDVKHALQEFSRLLAMAKRIPDPEGICNAHMELAFAYKEIDDTANIEKHLNLFRESAVQFNLPYKLARAHYYTGEHFLNQMKANLATAHLEKAFTLYYDLGSIEEADRARIITGISRGQERIEQYIDLILRCEDRSGPALLKICAWKSNRDIFWAGTKRDIATTDDFHEYCEDSTPPILSISNEPTSIRWK